MANPWSTTALLASLKRRGMIPTTSIGLSPTDIYDLMTAELQTYVTALILRAREEHRVMSTDVPILGNVASYDIPARASGDKLQMVQISDTGSSGQFRPLKRIESTRVSGYSTSGNVIGFELQDESIVLVPTPGSGGATLRIFFFYRPGICVDYASVGEILSINTATNTITFANTLPGTFLAGLKYDLVKGTPNFRYRAIDRVCTSVTPSTRTMVFAGPLPADLAPGDIVCTQYQSGIPQCPVELFPLLAQRTVFKLLEAIGDPKAVVTKQICDQMEKDAMTLLAPRVEGSARIVINPYGPGWRRNRYRR